MNSLLDWFVAKNFVSVRSVMLYIAVGMTYDATKWAERYADAHPDKSGVEMGAIILAVTAAVTALTGFIYKFYSDSRTGEGA